jgi:choline dehydrogenase-like flavoprotein
MLIDFRGNEQAAETPSDVCIVGAGAAGIPLARRLAASGRSVCVLESGGLQYEQETQNLYLGENVGMDYYDLEESRLRFFGGTTRIWGGRCALLNHIDFEHRDWVPNSGWPIDRAVIDTYYRQAHDQFELDEFNYEESVWTSLGIDDPQFDPLKIQAALWRFDELTERYGPSRCQDLFARCQDLFDSEQIRILLHANVTHIQASDDGRHVESVVVRTLGGGERSVAARYFVLAAGAIENPRLMLSSNDVEKTGLGNSHDQVGRYFMEHPVGRIARVDVAEPFEMWAARSDS